MSFYEVLEPRTARTIASFTNTEEKSPAITVNDYGKGHAIYVAVPAQMSVLAPLMRSLYGRVGIERGPETPAGVYARLVEGRTLYVNTTDQAKSIDIHGTMRGIVSGKSYNSAITLGPHDADLVE